MRIVYPSLHVCSVDLLSLGIQFSTILDMARPCRVMISVSTGIRSERGLPEELEAWMGLEPMNVSFAD